MPYLYRRFCAKEPYTQWLFCEKLFFLQLKASYETSPPCTTDGKRVGVACVFICASFHWYVTWLTPVTCMWHDSLRYLHATRFCMGDIIHSYATCMTYSCASTHSYVTWLTPVPYMWHDSLMCLNATWFFHEFVIHSYVTWLIHMCQHSFIRDMTHSCTIHVTWLTHVFKRNMVLSWVRDSFVCDMTYSYVPALIHTWRDSLLYHICDMTHPRI